MSRVELIATELAKARSNGVVKRQREAVTVRCIWCNAHMDEGEEAREHSFNCLDSPVAESLRVSYDTNKSFHRRVQEAESPVIRSQVARERRVIRESERLRWRVAFRAAKAAWDVTRVRLKIEEASVKRLTKKVQELEEAYQLGEAFK
ncbi:MAG TPA: hypothetical protein VM537_24170 [Anaerolineae bacterium]|nr:hypothetical protein [Anaerolineae bacterium]